jgi:sugar lactone lactonase YvrE
MTVCSKKFYALLLATALLTGCSGSDGAPAAGALPAAGGHALGKHTMVTLKIRVPRRKAPTKRGHHTPRYISPSTQSVVYVISGPVPSNTVIASAYMNIGTSSSYCSSAGALQPLTCTVNLPMAIPSTGSYIFNVATYDATQSSQCMPESTPACAGNLLSGVGLPQTLTIGANNQISLTLGGIAAGISVSPIGNGYVRGDADGLRLWGSGAQRIAVNALDIDGNPIIGPGAPTIAVTSNNTSKLTVLPGTNQPNVFTLRAPTSGSPSVVTPGLVDLTVALTPPSTGGGNLFPNQLVPVRIAHSAIYITHDGGGAVTAFFDGNTSNSTGYVNVVTGLNSGAGLATDGNGTLYAADDFESTITALSASGTVTTMLTSANGINDPEGIATDSNGTLYVTNEAAGEIQVFPPGATSASVTLALPAGQLCYYDAIDSSGTLYVSCQEGTGAAAVYEYPAGFSNNTSPATTILTATESPGAIAVDGNGTLYVVNQGVGTISVFPVGSSTASLTTSAFDAWTVAVDASGNVYATDQLSHVDVFPAGFTNPAPASSFTTNGNAGNGITIVPNALTP